MSYSYYVLSVIAVFHTMQKEKYSVGIRLKNIPINAANKGFSNPREFLLCLLLYNSLCDRVCVTADTTVSPALAAFRSASASVKSKIVQLRRLMFAKASGETSILAPNISAVTKTRLTNKKIIKQSKNKTLQIPLGKSSNGFF